MAGSLRELEGLLERANHFTYGDGGDSRVGQALATEAVGRGLLALIPLVKEIGDQLDTIPRREPVIDCEVVDESPADPLWDAPRYKAAALLERTAVGDEGEQRELTIARLVLGSAPRYSPDYAADVAVHALHAARDAGGVNKVKLVEAAITTLGIEIEELQ